MAYMVSSLPRCGGCSRAIRGRRKDTCKSCNKFFHKKCSGRDAGNLCINYQQNWVCSDCVSNTTSTSEEVNSIMAGITASAMNERFSVIDSEENDDEFDLLIENSFNKYYEPEDLNVLLNTSKNSDLFTMCINIRGLNIQKNFAKLEALVQSLPKKPHVIAINETFVKEGEEGFFENLRGYKFFSK